MISSNKKPGPIIAVGDYIRDPLCDEIRKVVRIDEDDRTLYMRDGGVMGVDEVGYGDVLLESEAWNRRTI